MKASEVVLGLGSNRADPSGRKPAAIIEAAARDLKAVLRDLRQAAVRETEPLYVEDQAPFLNTAVWGLYEGTPRELLEQIHAVEARYGRDRSRERRWGERTLDIDILLFGDTVICEEDLEIPHPRLGERVFALEPLLELCPGAKDPVTGVPYRRMLERGTLLIKPEKAIIQEDGKRRKESAPFQAQ